MSWRSWLQAITFVRITSWNGELLATKKSGDTRVILLARVHQRKIFGTFQKTSFPKLASHTVFAKLDPALELETKTETYRLNMVAENHPVREVLKQVVTQTTVSAEQVRILEQFVKQDWVIDEHEAKFLFRVNQALGSNHDDCAEWTDFYVTSICRLVVMDMNSPGQIDSEEGDWLASMFDKYSVDNDSQKKLMFELQKSTTSIKGKLGERLDSISQAASPPEAFDTKHQD